MRQVLSAKDKAFEQERVKYRQRIRELEWASRMQSKEEHSLLQQLQEAQSKIREQDGLTDSVNILILPGKSFYLA